MIIDAHNHADWCGHDFDKMIANMDRYHIDKTWILSWESPEGEYNADFNARTTGCVFSRGNNTVPVGFEQCLAYKQKAPDRFILGYAPDPRRADAIAALKTAMEVFGVQVCGEVKFRILYNTPDVLDMFDFCGDAGLPVTLHYDNPKAVHKPVNGCTRSYWWYGGGIDSLAQVLEECPKTNFLGHAPGFWSYISNDELADTAVYPKGPVILGGKIEKMLEKYPNLYCDISAGSGRIALSRDMEYTYRLMTRFPDRFVYARDYFDNGHQELIEQLGLPQNVKEMIYHENAERLVRPL